MAVTIAGLAACGDEAPAEPRPSTPGAILEFDELAILRGDVEAWFPYLESWSPKSGTKSRYRAALSCALPIALARRDFPTERARQLRLATEARSVCGNSLELAEFARARGVPQEDEPYSRTTLPVPMAEFAFREEHVGAVSPPIETERGYVLVGVTDLMRGAATSNDLVHLVVVPFFTHDRNAHDAWLEAAQRRARDRLTYVHPDITDALPRWLAP